MRISTVIFIVKQNKMALCNVTFNQKTLLIAWTPPHISRVYL